MGAGVCNDCRKTVDTCTCLFLYQKQREVAKNQRAENMEKYRTAYEFLMQTNGKRPTVLEVCIFLTTIENKRLKELLDIVAELKKD